jgi:hypothetical protein
MDVIINLMGRMALIGADERRYVHVKEFMAQSNGLIHRKERKAQPQKSLNSEEIIRPGTRMTIKNRR